MYSLMNQRFILLFTHKSSYFHFLNYLLTAGSFRFDCEVLS
jgi:hypothetical protein